MISQTQQEMHPIDLRFKMGWTLQQLAAELGYSYQACLYWSSKRRNPSIHAREKAWLVWQKYQTN
ncbi:MAG: helix-turn-helix transcriptional regulator [Limnoraphis sp. WC205]|jgi:hypothetical protein|nr:helix-turn-helix transcriptional regulator [Limnoraphis sp. WC205]